MELLTQNLPSGQHYPFASIRINPLNFAQILEYLENVPDMKKNPIEHYYFQYCLVKDEDPNINELLLIDMEYVIYMKKALTIAENLEYKSECKCPRCGNTLRYHVSLAGIEWTHMDEEARNGFQVNFGGMVQPVRMPKVSEFFEIFKKYRMYKKLSDIRIIKLIALFEQSMMYLQKVENQVINSVYKDVSVLFMLDNVFYNFVKPKVLHCEECSKMYEPTQMEIFEAKQSYGIKPEDELPEDLLYQIKYNHGGVEIGMETLVSEFFRDITVNNGITSEEILPREIHENAEH